MLKSLIYKYLINICNLHLIIKIKTDNFTDYN